MEELNLTNNQRNLLVRIIGNRRNKIDLESFGTDAIADVMTEIYEDPANNFIGFNDIAKIAVMKLKGKTEENIRKQLEVLQRASAELRSMGERCVQNIQNGVFLGFLFAPKALRPAPLILWRF